MSMRTKLPDSESLTNRLKDRQVLRALIDGDELSIEFTCGTALIVEATSHGLVPMSKMHEHLPMSTVYNAPQSVNLNISPSSPNISTGLAGRLPSLTYSGTSWCPHQASIK